MRWYLENTTWTENVRSGAYREWLAVNYAKRGSGKVAEKGGA